MNQFFKNINIVSCKKIHFFQRIISKIGHISQEFLSFFEKIFKILIVLEELYKSRENPDELYYLVETFIKKAKNCLEGRLPAMQRRRQDLFGGTLRPLKGYHALPAGGPGGEGPPPPDASEVSFFKTIQSIRK